MSLQAEEKFYEECTRCELLYDYLTMNMLITQNNMDFLIGENCRHSKEFTIESAKNDAYFDVFEVFFNDNYKKDKCYLTD